MSGDGSANKDDKTCGLCNEKPSKYCCPRCEVFYCSLDCYKSEKHNECSESFYRECVTDELSSYQADEESQKKMMDILKRMQEEKIDLPEDLNELLNNSVVLEDSDDDEVPGLHERLEGLNLNDAEEIWNALTQDERNDFEALLNQGDVGSIVPQWEPWWKFTKDEKAVEEIGVEDGKEEAALKKCPVLKAVPKLSLLTTTKPSPAIKYNITNVLASYAFVSRFFNGELDPIEAVTYILDICGNLDSNANYEEIVTAIQAVSQKCLQSELIETDDLSLEVMKHDTFLILQGPSQSNKLHYCKAALSHLHTLLTDARAAKKTFDNDVELPKQNKKNAIFTKKFPDHKPEHLPKVESGKIKKCIKKVEYYLSFLEDYGMEFNKLS